MSLDLVHSTGFGDVVREHRRSRPDELAVVDGDIRLTYRALDERSTRAAAVLMDHGLQSGDVVAWFGQNSHRCLELLLAAAKIGASLCPLNWRSTDAELEGLCDDLRPKIVVWQEQAIGDVARALQGGSPATWIQHDDEGPGGYESLLASARSDDDLPAVDPATPLLVLYTSAFGGRPSGAVLSHQALLHQGLVMALAAEVDSGYRYLNSGPLFHIATWMWTVPTLMLGGTNVYVPRADPEELCRVIERERCTAAFLMPPTVDQMTELNSDHRYDLSSLRSPSRSPAWDEMVSVDTSPMGKERGGYGQTEVTGLAVMAAYGGGRGAAGRPNPLVQMRIVDPDGAELPPGATGEIVLRGPTVFAGFHRDHERTATRLRDGWLHTGDLGRREDDGSLTFVGPMSRLIKSAAENIYPAEVEACLRTHPGVADCAVIGVPDATWSQRVKALVVPEDAPLTLEELAEHCRERIASYKKPTALELVDDIPRTAGAIDYDALDAAHGGGGYPGDRSAMEDNDD